MIIEITGIPGVGKTTLLKRVGETCKGKVVLFSRDLVLAKYNLNRIPGKILRMMVSEIILISILANNISRYTRFIKYCLSRLISLDEREVIKLGVLRNVLLKFAVNEFINMKCMDHIVIIDEGISHIPYNLTNYKTGSEPDPASTFKHLEPVTRSLKVIRLERDPDVIRTQLERRGHRRLKGNSAYSIDQFMHCNRLIAAAFESLPEHVFSGNFVLHLGNPDDTASFSNLFENEIMK